MVTPISTGADRSYQRVLSDRSSRAMWASRASDLLADWALLVALLAIVYRVSASVPAVALLVLARVVPRAVAALWPAVSIGALDTRALALIGALRVPLAASLALVTARSDLYWAAAVVVAISVLSTLSETARSSLLPRIIPRPLMSATNALNVTLERLCFVFGPLLGALVLSQWGPEEAFVVAAALFAVAAALALLQPRPPSTPGVPAENARLPAFRERPLLVTMALALFTSALVAASLIISLIALGTGPLGRAEAAWGALLACAGLGMFVGPLPISKLMNRLPTPFLLAGSAASLAGAMAVISQLTWLPAAAVILFLIGLCATTNDVIATTALRRSTRYSDLPGAVRAMRLATASGQVAGALALATLASIWDYTIVLLALGALGVVAAGTLFIALYGRYYLNRFSGRGKAAASA